MILRSVELENFGRFKNQSFEFRRGMNLVIGPNEAGKSTLAEAVPAVLFGTDRLERFKPWGRNACTAALFFEGGGRTVQIKRNLITDEVELVEKDDLYHVLSQFIGKASLRGRSASCREYRTLLESLLGVGDERLFRATYFFGHHPQEWSGDDLAQNLRTLVSGTAEADYAEILEALLEEHFSITSSNPWGRDKHREREYEEVCSQLKEIGGIEPVPVFVELDDTAEIERQIKSLSSELVSDRLEYEKGLRYLEQVRCKAASDVSVVEVNAESAQRVGLTENRSEDLAAQLSLAGLPSNPPRELDEILVEAAEIRQEMAELQQPYSVLNNREKKAPVVFWAQIVSGVALCMVSAGLAFWQQFYPLSCSVGSGAVALGLVGWGALRQISRRKVVKECKQQRGQLDQKKIAAQSKQAALSERCEALGLPSSPIDLVRLQKLVSASRELVEAYWRSQENLSAVVESAPVRGEVSHAEEPAADCAIAAEQVAELKELESRINDFEAGLLDKEQNLETLKQQLAEAVSEQPEKQPTNLALIRRKSLLEERIALLRMAINLLAESVEEFSASHLVSLNAEAGKQFGKITAGRYTELRLDENMLPSVKIDSRRWVTVDHFSRGTIDAIYLALRVALAKVRDDGRSLPLMLDDPFVHLDQKRLAKALNMVDLASADGQLILFSHNLELGKRAARERWHVVPMDGDKVDTSSEEEGGEHVGQLHLL